MSRRLITRCVVPLAFLAASPTAVPDAVAAQAPVGTQMAWTRIATGTGTGCGLGTPYSFFYREGTDPDRLLIYFQGGGACWDWVSCSGLFDSSVEPDEPVAFRGIFDRAEPRNPLRSYSVVFVPYCTGDVHIGDASVSYGADGSRPVAHRGFRNVSAVLAWVDARGLRPRTVVVAGTSAGAYGALFYMRPIARLFPHARLVLLGDSGVPLLSRNVEVLKTWGADPVMTTLWQGERGPRTLLEAYLQAARVGSRVRLAQITSDRDAIQSAFYIVSGSPEWRRAAYSLLADVKAVVPAFRTFIIAGADHGLLPTDAFYSYRAGDVALHEWVGRLIAGEAVDDVRCARCIP
jgi:Pectinacetylesterase